MPTSSRRHCLARASSGRTADFCVVNHWWVGHRNCFREVDFFSGLATSGSRRACRKCHLNRSRNICNSHCGPPLGIRSWRPHQSLVVLGNVQPDCLGRDVSSCHADHGINRMPRVPGSLQFASRVASFWLDISREFTKRWRCSWQRICRSTRYVDRRKADVLERPKWVGSSRLFVGSILAILKITQWT